MKPAQLFNSALFLLLVSVSTTAHAQGGQGKKSDPSSHGKAAPQTDKHAQTPAHDNGRKAEKPAPAPATRRATVQAPRPAAARASRPATVRAAAAPSRVARPVPVPAAVQSQRARAEQQRAAQYRLRLDQQVRLGQQRSAQLQQQKHLAQYRAQQQYLAQLRAQQLRLQTARNYSNDPYVRAVPTYRYVYSGYNRETNQYGADVLRQAVRDGYQEGVRFGQADRQDGLSPNFQNNYAYQDANYGYAGNYVDQSDYNYYFRQGFQRGYTDGYYGRSQYGTTSLNGSSSILGNLLTTILGLVSLR